MSIRVCKVCKKKFNAHQGQRKYCSYQCAEIAEKKRAIKRKGKDYLLAVCPVCKKQFERETAHKIYCSTECKSIAKKIRNYKKSKEEK